MHTITINLDEPVNNWHERLMAMPQQNDFLIFHEKINDLVWFATRYAQFLTTMGRYEISTFYGNHIHSLADFTYQMNYALPVCYRLKEANNFELYELLLNLETDPPNRFLFWNDAQHLFLRNEIEFDDVFDSMVVAAYNNKNGTTTIKEDGSRYLVNQRNLFFFHELKPGDLTDIVNKERYIPSTDGPFNKVLEFNCILFEGGD